MHSCSSRAHHPRRLAVNNDWLLEEGLGLFLVCYLLPTVISSIDHHAAGISLHSLWSRGPLKRTPTAWDFAAGTMGCSRRSVRIMDFVSRVILTPSTAIIYPHSWRRGLRFRSKDTFSQRTLLSKQILSLSLAIHS